MNKKLEQCMKVDLSGASNLVKKAKNLEDACVADVDLDLLSKNERDVSIESSVSSLFDHESDSEDNQSTCEESHSNEDSRFLADFKEVARNINISHSDLSKILKVLNKYHHNFPVDARTLLGTCQRPVTLRHVEPGQYHHFGLEKGIISVTHTLRITDKDLYLVFNFDGLPLHKSSTICFWPILCSIHKYPQSVFIVGAYCGSKKPDNCFDYLSDLIEELKKVLQHGVLDFVIHFHCCCCDTPARHFVLNVKSHGGFYGCERCYEKGKTIENRRVFLNTNSKKRTDASFRVKDQPDHHKGDSPFEQLPGVDLVLDFPQDYMHSVCKGLTFKLLEELRSGSHQRLSVKLLQEMSRHLLSLRKDIPREFSRRPRSMDHLATWKATEQRLFLLYLAPTVLPKYCSSEFSGCFNILIVILRIYCSDIVSAEYLQYAKDLTDTFHARILSLFGEKFFVYNVHSLCHLHDDVARFGQLDSFSCFLFENFLRFIKRKMRCSKNPLEQLVRRVGETDQSLGHCILRHNTANSLHYETRPSLDVSSVLDLNRDIRFYEKCVIGSGSCVLQANTSDSYVTLKGNALKPFKIMYFAWSQNMDGIHMIGYPLNVIGSIFTEPLPSEKIGMVKISGDVSKLQLKMKKISDIAQKAMLLEQKYFVVLLHSLQHL